MSADCIFCKIVKGEIPAEKVHETEKVLAFKDISPMSPVHLIIIPKQHYDSLEDIPSSDLGLVTEMIEVARKLANQNNIAEAGYRLAMNVREAGGQTVFHVHMHLLGGRPMGPSLVG